MTDRIFICGRAYLVAGYFFAIAGAAAIGLLFPRVGQAVEKPEDNIILIGLDSMNNSVTMPIPASVYQRNLSTAVDSVRDSLLPALKKRATDQKSSAPKWHLNSIGVGVGLSGNFGLGPIINVTLSPQIKLVFTNSKNPVYPN